MKDSEPKFPLPSNRLIRMALMLPFLTIAGCGDKAATATPTPAPSVTMAFEPGPRPNRSSSSDLSRIDEAMKFSDVEFLLRVGNTEAAILNEIATRGFVEQVTAAKANSLSTHGASARLIALVQDRQYVLTPEEAVEYKVRSDRRAQKGAPVRSADPRQRQKDFEERQRRIHMQNNPVQAGSIAARGGQ
jgi:hypothetical protein